MAYNRKNIDPKYFANGNSIKELAREFNEEAHADLEFAYVIHLMKNRITLDEFAENEKFPVNAENLRILNLIIKHGEIAGKQVYLHEYKKKKS